MGTSVSAILTVTTPAIGVTPGPATGLTTSAVTATTLTLSWSAPTTGTLPFSYRVQQQVQGSSTWVDSTAAVNGTTASVTLLAASTTYVFQILTSNSNGTTASAASNPITMLAAIPGPATALVTSNVTTTTLTLTWLAPVSGTPPFSYRVQQQIQGSPTWVNSTATINGTSAAISLLATATTYIFQVLSSNSAGTTASAASNPVLTGSVLPGAPTGLQSSLVQTTTFTLSWNAPTTGTPPYTYLVYQSPHSANNFVQVTSTGPTSATTVSAAVSGLLAAHSYDFEVFAQNTVGTGPVSAILSVTTAAVLPGAPTGLAVVGSPTTTTVTLSWVAPASGSSPFSYQVFVATPSGSATFLPVGAVVSNTSEQITGLTAATSYDFTVAASNAAGQGPQSAALLNVVTASTVVIPSSPQSLAASAVTQTTFTLSWSAPVSGTPPFTYLVSQSPSGANTFTQIASTSSLSQAVTGLSASTAYDYRVVAQNTVGSSPPSAILTVPTLAPPVIIPIAPTGLTSTAATTTTVTLAWNVPTVGTQPMTYATRWSATGQNAWTAGPTSTVTSAVVTGLTAGLPYDFEVNASNAAGSSAYSGIYTASTAASAAPTVTWAPGGASGTITLSNSNFTATSGGSTAAGAAVQTCISTTALSVGNVAWEVTLGTVTQNLRVGLVNSSFPFNNQLGSDTNSIGFLPATGTGSPAAQTVLYGGSVVLAPGASPPGADVATDVISFCVTLPSVGPGLFWVTSPKMRTAYGASAWNNSTTASPATGVGGIAFTIAPPLSLAFNEGEGGGAGTLNAGSSAFSFAGVPSNFIPWNGSATTIVAPSAPTLLTSGTITAATVALSWTAPATGTPAYTYVILQSIHNANSFASAGNTNLTTFTVTGLASSQGYDFVVYASNSAGKSLNSNLVFITTATSLTVPGAPSGLSVGTAAPNSLPLSWQAPTTGGTPTGYQVQYKLIAAGSYTNFPTVVLPPQVITGTGGGKVTDNDSNVWTIAGGQVVLNGVADGSTSNVITLTYAGGLIWQENTGLLWYSTPLSSGWTGGTSTGPVSPTQTITAGPAGRVTDNFSNVWTITSTNVVSVNGVAQTANTSAAIQIAYDGTVIWHQNDSGSWYSTPLSSGWTGGTTTGPVSPTQTVNAGSGGSITDTIGNVWTITSGNLVAVNGVPDNTTSNVATIAIAAGVMWQKNTGLLWWSKTTLTPTWTQGSGPTTVLQSATFAGSAGSITDARGNVWTIVGGSQLALNGQIDGGATAVIAIAIAAGVIWYETARANWWQKTNMATVWGGGTTTGPGTGLSQTITGLTSNTQYDFQVYAFNGSGNGAVSAPPVVGTTTALATNFSISGGKVIAPNGSAWIGRGVALGGASIFVGTAAQLTVWVTNAASQPLRTLFPKINMARVPVSGFVDPSTIAPYINRMTALNIVCVIENHQAFNVGGERGGTGNGIWSAAGGGSVGTIPNGSNLATETNWYNSMAQAFKTNPYVWLGTTNEPTPWQIGGAYDLVGLANWQAAIYNAIRATGNNNIVEIEQSVPTDQGASRMPASVFAPMRTIVFGPHYYPWIWGNSAGNGQTQLISEATMLNSAKGSTNSPNGGIVQQVQNIQTIRSADGVVPCGCFEYGDSTVGRTIDVSGQNCVQAVIDSVANTVLFCSLAWLADYNGGNAGDRICNSATSLTSPYGTAVASAILTNTQ